MSDTTNQNTDQEPTNNKLPQTSISELSETLREACNNAGWPSLTPVQCKALPYVLADRDIMVQARTGSGKTGAFVLPLLDKLNPALLQCQALVLVPTRELARQVAEEARMLAGGSGINVVEVYGGVGYGAQLDAFKAGAQLVVGTPGRILDHLLKRNLNLDSLKVLIFDEADRMLSVGFYPDMRDIQTYLPKEGGYSAFMFSATYPGSVLRLADEFLNKPEMLSLSGDQVHVADIEHVMCKVPGMGKERILMRLIELENPSSAIIFSNTKRDVHYIAEVLKNFGYEAEAISSDLNQNKREKVLGKIRANKLRFLVATDVAARGIDIRELSHVFLYEPPDDPESYIHRAGRTGRAGASGTVITFADIAQVPEMKRIAMRYKIDLVEREAPEDSEVTEVIEERITALLDAKRRKLDALQGERIMRLLPMAKRLADDEDGVLQLAMLLDVMYQDSMRLAPAEPEQAAPAPEQKASPRKKQPRKRKPRNAEENRGENNGRQARSPKPSEPRSEPRPPREQQVASEGSANQGGDQDGEPKKRRRRRRPRRR
ncbi:DEAD/DEAH box helicase [Pseudodesulfovibrio senegalensis]|uniref:DEAD/DEAH box helicase n=1 Tax=Pseudodesulfovibrio senegalensis TaxID=1721087 RepID=A0A6N6N1Q4_9BACT|nr:DEAD/DEAH box helicase [Pseudodesulfovibrio senegalensis]KAB1441460.1 DEAD/DEAH box helicase [Pseudodesulfovibrio senegalensis]